MDIAFNCDFCGQDMVIDETGAGAVIKCPKYSENVVVPPQKPPVQVVASKLRHCPDCRREISRRAATCPHCGAPLGSSPATIESSIVSSGSDKRILPAFLLCVFFGAIGAHAFYAGRSGQGGFYLVCMAGSAAILLFEDYLPMGVGAVLWSLLIMGAVFLIGDLIRILIGSYKDGRDLKITKWT